MLLKNRDNSIDALRGIAIFIMILANAAPYIFPEPHPFWLRSIDSFAAPIFISLAGFGISLNLKENLLFSNKLLIRGLLTILTAALIDTFTWKIMPFIGYDVLYLIGFSLVIASFYGKISTKYLIAIIFGVLLISFLIQENGFYKSFIEDLKLERKNLIEIPLHWNAFISYGWFPIFPWLAIFTFGYVGGRLNPKTKVSKHLLTLFLFVIFCLTLFFIFNQNKLIREGYSELFYPADHIFILNILSLLTMIWLNRNVFKSNFFSMFRILGKCSLFIYIVHSIIISRLIENFYEFTNKNHFITYLIFYLLIFSLALLLEFIKKSVTWKKAPFLVKFVFGS